ncbi:hypothetical protein [Methylobacterium isbiliense]|uniref:DUF4089 domain-containing protein n=1 Tax=Methylobacterium isbiliense TaxID=315478 RepID=A0ABQ4SF51_9HYPH|nr:hypothetical protein [Methylobacterium isbiliense]MDN3622603.1 hypothetical protein [Methylobacterium isbiliense]GJE00548.1 hypothetical protein GMJLKIPL_2471 [Methylobacterium isbiliense]
MTDADRPLTDEDVHDRLHAALEALGDGRPETIRGYTAHTAARRALALLQFALVAAMEAGSDHLPGVAPPLSERD